MSSINFHFLILCKANKSVIFNYYFMIDLREMPIDEYSRQLLPESRKYIEGQPNLDNLQLCYDHVAV